MKTIIYLVMISAMIIVFACSSPKAEVQENPYEGAWVQTYIKYGRPDSIIERTQFENPDIKLLTKKHYAFGHQSGENEIYGGGGEYSFKEDTFISYPKYHTSSGVVGKTVVWKSKIEGDLWTISTVIIRKDSVKIERTQIWKRIPE